MLEENMRNASYLTTAVGFVLLIVSYFLPVGTSTLTAIICGTLKQELVYDTYFYTKKQAKKEIFEYIEFYNNRHRSHSYSGNLSPVKFEEKQKILRNEMVA